MAAIAFDTLQAARKPDLATKADLRAELAELKADILKWLFGALAAQAGVIVALLKLLP